VQPGIRLVAPVQHGHIGEAAVVQQIDQVLHQCRIRAARRARIVKIQIGLDHDAEARTRQPRGAAYPLDLEPEAGHFEHFAKQCERFRAEPTRNADSNQACPLRALGVGRRRHAAVGMPSVDTVRLHSLDAHAQQQLLTFRSRTAPIIARIA
jgi:hypothetical protein